MSAQSGDVPLVQFRNVPFFAFALEPALGYSMEFDAPRVVLGGDSDLFGVRRSAQRQGALYFLDVTNPRSWSLSDGFKIQGYPGTFERERTVKGFYDFDHGSREGKASRDRRNVKDLVFVLHEKLFGEPTRCTCCEYSAKIVGFNGSMRVLRIGRWYTEAGVVLRDVILEEAVSGWNIANARQT